MTSAPDPNDRHFRTDHLLKDLRGRSVRGGVVTITAQVARLGLQMGSTAVLARLLAPGEHGLVAMVTSITGFVAAFAEAGLSAATVQRKEITHAQVSTLFWLNAALAFAVAAVIAALSPAIAWFYDDPRLTAITLVTSSTMVFSGLGVQHQALLRRQMRFKHLAMMDVGAMACGVAAGVAMALTGHGYWSLVGLSVVTSASHCAFAWGFSGWRPGRAVRGSGVGDMLKFGGNLTGFNVLSYASRNMDNVLIGWWWGAAPLGLYTKAYALLMLPVRQINVPVSSVVLPALSRLQSEPERYRRYYCRAIALVAAAGMPVCAFAFVAAEPLVRILLGDRWLGAVPLFQALSPAAFAGTMNIANGWVFVSLGRTDRQFRWGIVMAVITVSAFAIGLPWGPMGVSVAYSAVFVLSRWPGVAYCFRGTPLVPSDVGRSIWRQVTAALVAAAAALALRLTVLDGTGPVAELAVIAVVYPVVFFACVRVLPGGGAMLADLRTLVTELRRKPNARADGAATGAANGTANDGAAGAAPVKEE